MKIKTAFLALAYLLITSILVMAEDTPAPVNAHQVIEKFVESQKNLKSFIIKSNTKRTFSYTGFNGTGTSHSKSELRFDGNRAKALWTTWGDVGNTKVSKENADYLI